MDYTYSYFIALVPLILIWISLYLVRIDTRKEMRIMSFVFGGSAFIVQPIYLLDWWRPLTITGTALGLEDFIFGACVGGVAAAVYEIIFSRRLIRFSNELASVYIFYASLASCGALFFSAVAYGVSSPYASFIALLLPVLFIWVHRMDLIQNSLSSGLLTALAVVPSFILVEMLTPGWVLRHWDSNALLATGGLIGSVPLGDVLWTFLVGCFVGPLYEYSYGLRGRSR